MWFACSSHVSEGSLWVLLLPLAIRKLAGIVTLGLSMGVVRLLGEAQTEPECRKRQVLIDGWKNRWMKNPAEVKLLQPKSSLIDNY